MHGATARRYDQQQQPQDDVAARRHCVYVHAQNTVRSVTAQTLRQVIGNHGRYGFMYKHDCGFGGSDPFELCNYRDMVRINRQPPVRLDSHDGVHTALC
jgi:hypothetical protein